MVYIGGIECCLEMGGHVYMKLIEYINNRYMSSIMIKLYIISLMAQTYNILDIIRKAEKQAYNQRACSMV